MLRSFRLGSAFGIPVYLHPTFLLLPLVMLFMTWPLGLTGVVFMEVFLLSMFACVVLHEFGHVLMARMFGIGTRDVTLYPIGGVARLESTGASPGQELCISLAGPAVNLLIALLLAPLVAAVVLAGGSVGPDAILSGAGRPLSLLGSYLVSLCLGNLGLMAFNLIPAFPMDGGRVLRALLSLRLGLLRATEIAAGLGLVLAIGLAVLGLAISSVPMALVAIFVAVVGQLELQALRQREARRLAAVPVVEVLQPTALAGFTGFVWDRDRNNWVRWVDGRPVEVPRDG